MKLRQYQEESIRAIYQAYRQGSRRQCLVLATGLGKTVIFSELVRQVEDQAVVMVHREELVRQTIDKLVLFGIDRDDIGIVRASQDEIRRPCVVASQQTLQRGHRLERLLAGPARRLIVVDECHHLSVSKRHPDGNTWYQIVQACADTWDKALVLGCTATPFRSNNAPIIGAEPLPFQIAPFTMGIAEGIARGFLCGVEGRRVTLDGLNLDAVKRQAGDWSDTGLEKALRDCNALPVVFRAWLRHAEGLRTLVYFPTVAMTHEFAGICTDHGVRAEVVTGGTSHADRKDIYQGFRDGDVKIISNCCVLTEGFDEPATECILIARPTTSRVLYQQTIGRGLRTFPGKENCIIVDCVGATERHELMSVAHIAGLIDAPIDVTDDEHGDAESDGDANQDSEGQSRKRVNGTIELASREEISIYRKSPMRWVKTLQGKYVLGFYDGFIRLVAIGEGHELWDVEWKPNNGQYQRLVSHVPFEYAQGAAEDTARDRENKLINRQAPWLKMPVTQGQIPFARKLGINTDLYQTRGELSDAITAIVGDW